jgi:hypothetical protein
MAGFRAQRGAAGTALGDTAQQRVADAFVANFDDPARLLPAFGGVGAMRAAVRDQMGESGDLRALGGLFAVLGRQVANAVA